MGKIDENRVKIDEIDNRIMELLDLRFNLTTEIGELKKLENRVVLDSNREQVILDKATKFSHYPQLQTIYKTIMNESKSLQRK
jgi:chorismate mutase